MTDDEILIAKYNSGDMNACEELLTRYKSRVSSLARPYFLIGGSNDDLVQEGMIGLYKAITTFNPDKGIRFSQFATTCIKQSIYDALRNANRDKHKPLNTSISIQDMTVDIEDRESPEELFLDNEKYSTIMENINKTLSKSEQKILTLYLDGYSYLEMADTLGKDTKYIDNVLQRIKRKIKKNITL